jgi:hypothetical protein
VTVVGHAQSPRLKYLFLEVFLDDATARAINHDLAPAGWGSGVSALPPSA